VYTVDADMVAVSAGDLEDTVLLENGTVRVF
jgi:hypothetical protein